MLNTGWQEHRKGTMAKGSAWHFWSTLPSAVGWRFLKSGPHKRPQILKLFFPLWTIVLVAFLCRHMFYLLLWSSAATKRSTLRYSSSTGSGCNFCQYSQFPRLCGFDWILYCSKNTDLWLHLTSTVQPEFVKKIM